MKKFKEGDIFINKLKTHPKVRFFAYSGSIYIDNEIETSLTLNDFLAIIPPSEIITTEDNILLVTEDERYLKIE